MPDPSKFSGQHPCPVVVSCSTQARGAEATLYPPALSPRYLRALDVIVQVVPECVDQVYGVVSGSSVGVTGEQH